MPLGLESLQGFYKPVGDISQYRWLYLTSPLAVPYKPVGCILGPRWLYPERNQSVLESMRGD